MHWRAGDSARPHQHPEEQAIYVIIGPHAHDLRRRDL